MVKDGKATKFKTKGACYRCGRKGHYARDCLSNKSTTVKTAPSGKDEAPKFPKWKPGLRFKGKPKPAVESDSGGAKSEDFPKKNVTFAMSAFHTNVSAEGDMEKDQVTFIVDSGATSHMTSAIALLADVELHQGTVTVAGGRVLISTGKGTMRLIAQGANGEECFINLEDVLIVPDLGRNLLSVPKLSTRGGRAIFDDGTDSYIQMGKVRLPIEYINELYLWKPQARARRRLCKLLPSVSQCRSPNCGMDGLAIRV